MTFLWSSLPNSSASELLLVMRSGHCSSICVSESIPPHLHIVSFSVLDHRLFSQGRSVLPSLKRDQAILQCSGKCFLVTYTSWTARVGFHCLYNIDFVLVDPLILARRSSISFIIRCLSFVSSTLSMCFMNLHFVVWPETNLTLRPISMTLDNTTCSSGLFVTFSKYLRWMSYISASMEGIITSWRQRSTSVLSRTPKIDLTQDMYIFRMLLSTHFTHHTSEEYKRAVCTHALNTCLLT